MTKLRYIVNSVFLFFLFLFTLLSVFFSSLIFNVLLIFLIVTAFGLNLFFFFQEKALNMARFKDWQDIAYQLHISEEDAFTNLPIGIITFNDSYDVTFLNHFARAQFDFELLHKPIYTIDLALSSFIDSDLPYQDLKLNNHYFRFLTNKQEHVLYFFDITSLEELKQKSNASTLALGFIKVDDLLQIDKKYALSDKTTLYSQITYLLSNYFAKFDACFELLDNDNYIVVTSRKGLDLMVKDKFSLLEDIRALALKSQTQLTISFGIACYNTKTTEVFDRALNAIDLAEKRGGDQVVVNIEGEHLQYFGAKASLQEKNSYVISRLQTQNLKDSITSSSNVLIMAHYMADLDALGAIFGAYLMAKSSIHHTYIVLAEDRLEKTALKAYNLYLKGLVPDVITLDRALEVLNEETLLLIVDTQSPDITMFKELPHKASRISLIDHHRAGEKEFKNVETSYVETSSSSTVELITEMFSFYDQSIIPPAGIATTMLAGLVVDTNNFTFRTGSRTFHAASILKDYGASMITVRKLLRDDLDEEKLLSSAINNAEILMSEFAIACLDEPLSDRTILAKVSERLLKIDQITASFTIANMQNGNVAISARSLGDLNVQLIMEQFGGGGHLEAAATELKNTTIATVKAELIATLKDYLVQDEGDNIMEIILLEDIKGKGKKNDIISVPNGFANFLINKGQALLATEQNKANLAFNLKEEANALEKKRQAFLLLKEDIEKCNVTVFLKIGKDNKAFGQITAKQVAEELNKQYGIDLDRKKIDLPTINTLGSFKGIVNLDKDIKAELSITVTEQ